MLTRTVIGLQVMLPDQLPPHFQATYTPIAAAGTEGQIKHMGRLLANQLTAAGMGKGIAEVQLEVCNVKSFSLILCLNVYFRITFQQ